MLKRLITILIIWLERFTYEPLTVDNANQKLIVPVHGLVIDGRQLYRYKNELDIPIKRKVAISGAYKWFGATISLQEVIDFVRQIREANNQQDASRIGLLAYSLEDMLSNCSDAEALYRMGAARYFFKEEDHSQYDSDISLEKVHAFRRLTGEKKDFFLRTLLQHMGISDDTSLKTILNNLKQSKVKMDAYRRLLSEGGSARSSLV